MREGWCVLWNAERITASMRIAQHPSGLVRSAGLCVRHAAGAGRPLGPAGRCVAFGDGRVSRAPCRAPTAAAVATRQSSRLHNELHRVPARGQSVPVNVNGGRGRGAHRQTWKVCRPARSGALRDSLRRQPSLARPLHIQDVLLNGAGLRPESRLRPEADSDSIATFAGFVEGWLSTTMPINNIIIINVSKKKAMNRRKK